MKTFILPDPWLITDMRQSIHKLKKGLILVAASDQNWIDFIVLGLLGTYQWGNFEIVFKNEPGDTYYFKHIAERQSPQSASEKLYFYGNLKNKNLLESAIECSQNHLTMAVMHVTSPEAVIMRMTDMIGKEDEELYKSVVKCLVSNNADIAFNINRTIK